MTIWRYTCSQCGIVTRVEDGQVWKVCACVAPPVIINEDDEVIPPEPLPEPV